MKTVTFYRDDFGRYHFGNLLSTLYPDLEGWELDQIDCIDLSVDPNKAKPFVEGKEVKVTDGYLDFSK